MMIVKTESIYKVIKNGKQVCLGEETKWSIKTGDKY